jgi:hypothetical protein
MEHFSLGVFSEQLNTEFSLSLPEQTIPLRLSEAVDKGSNARQEQFSLVFQGPLQPVLQQNTYSFKHTQLGEFMLFIVPIGQNGAGIQYQVIFNRLLNNVTA